MKHIFANILSWCALGMGCGGLLTYAVNRSEWTSWYGGPSMALTTAISLTALAASQLLRDTRSE